MVREVFPPFPDVVDEISARLVATGAVALSVAVIATGSTALAAVVAVGFWLRVAGGPHRSPLALLVTRLIRLAKNPLLRPLTQTTLDLLKDLRTGPDKGELTT